MNAKDIELLLKFLIFGILVGITEDVIAIKLTTGAPITWITVVIVVLIAIPFAVVGELVATRVNFAKIFNGFFSKKKARNLK